MYPQYMCILLICVHLFGVTVFHRCIVNWSWVVDVSSVYVHFAICDTYVVVMVFHRSIVNWSLGVHMIYPQYMCILLYVISYLV